MTILTLDGVNKHYGDKHALIDFDYEFKDGVYGLLAVGFAVVDALGIYIPYYVYILFAYGTQRLFDSAAGVAKLAGFGGLSVLGYLILLMVYRIISL